MINKIEITINNGAIKKLDMIIFPDKELCNLNDKKYIIDKERIKEILDILCTWKYEYGNNDNTIDSEEFTINVYSNNEKTKYHGKGAYPYNYSKFLNILGGIQNGK